MLSQNQTQQVELQAAAKRLTAARIDLLSSQPFFGMLAMKLELIPKPGYEYLAAVDGKHMLYNPAEVCRLEHEEAVGLFEHEILHLALRHHVRREERPFRGWQTACDYAVNSILVGDGKRLPEGALHSHMWDGMAAEEIYAKMGEGDQGQGQPDQGQPDQDPGQSQGQPDQGQPDQDPGQSRGQDFGVVLDEDNSPEASEQEWDVNLTQAMKAAEKAGNMPGGLKLALQAELNPKTPWRHVLRSLLTSLSRDDYNWARPNKRYLSSGLYLPEARSEAAGTLVVVVDTSGSINKPLLDSFVSELNSIFNEISYDELRVLFVGIKVRESKTFYSNEPLELGEFTSGGGTRFRPAFERMEEDGIVPDALIYFTDLRVGERPEDPGYPVIWATPAKTSEDRWAWEPGFGEVLELFD